MDAIMDLLGPCLDPCMQFLFNILSSLGIIENTGACM